jgi:hypothetical protein
MNILERSKGERYRSGDAAQSHALRPGGGFHDCIAPQRYSTLLVALVVTFAIRPLIGDTAASSAVFSIGLVLLLLVALYNINVDELVGERGRLLIQARRRLRLGWVLAVAAALEHSRPKLIGIRRSREVGTPPVKMRYEFRPHTCILL